MHAQRVCCFSKGSLKQQLQRIMQVNQTPWKFLGILCNFSNTHSRNRNLVVKMSDGRNRPTHVAIHVRSSASNGSKDAKTYAVSATVGTIYVRGGLEGHEITLSESSVCRTFLINA